MVEKVLGYRKKDIEEMIKDWKFEAYATFPSKPERYFLKTVVAIHNLKDLFEKKQVPVRLRSESVSLRWLEDFVKEKKFRLKPGRYLALDRGKEIVIFKSENVIKVEDLLLAACKQAKVVKK